MITGDARGVWRDGLNSTGVRIPPPPLNNSPSEISNGLFLDAYDWSEATIWRA